MQSYLWISFFTCKTFLCLFSFVEEYRGRVSESAWFEFGLVKTTFHGKGLKLDSWSTIRVNYFCKLHTAVSQYKLIKENETRKN